MFVCGEVGDLCSVLCLGGWVPYVIDFSGGLFDVSGLGFFFWF